MSTTFSEKLTRLMAQRKLGVHDVAARLNVSAGHISNLRRDKKHPSPELAAELDDLLGAGGDLIAAAAETSGPPRRTVLGAGAGAAAAAAGLIPLWPEDNIGSPLEHFEKVRAVIGESDNLFGPLNQIDNVRRYIAMTARLRHGKSGKDAAGLLAMQARFSEQLAWLLQDARQLREASHWLDKALEAALMAGDQQWAAYTLVRKSQLAGDMHDPASAVDLAAAAARMAQGPARLRAAGAAYGACGHALAGDARSAFRDLDEADEIAAQSEDTPGAPWTAWLDTSYIDVHRARCCASLGDHTRAAGLYETAIAGMAPHLRRDRGVYIARQALAHAEAGDMDAAAGTGMRAAAICQAAPSGRIAIELRRLAAATRDCAAARPLREAITEVTRAVPAN